MAELEAFDRDPVGLEAGLAEALAEVAKDAEAVGKKDEALASDLSKTFGGGKAGDAVADVLARALAAGKQGVDLRALISEAQKSNQSPAGAAPAGTIPAAAKLPITQAFQRAARQTQDEQAQRELAKAQLLLGKANEHKAELVPFADLSGRDLAGWNLSGFDLRGVNLREANLQGTRLTGANLAGADLTGACLCLADASEANLDGATLTTVDATGASFVSASGTGWACGNVMQVVTCTSSTVIPAGGANPNPITLVVNVLGTAPNQVINSATISGGTEPPVNTGNNTVVDYVTVVRDGVSQFFPDGAQTALPNSTVWYPHEFVSTTAGNVVFNFSNVPSPILPGWQQTLYQDTNCNGTLDPAEATPLTNPTASFAVMPGTRICLIVREFVPAAAGIGAQDVISITATLTPAVGPVQVFPRTDTTTVGVPAALKLTKEVRNITTAGPFGTNNTGLPGNTLQYRITYQNNGMLPLNMLVVNDATPMFTTFAAAACGTLGGGLTACMVTTQPGVGATGQIIWNFTGALNPGASGTVTFDVIIAP